MANVQNDLEPIMWPFISIFSHLIADLAPVGRGALLLAVVGGDLSAAGLGHELALLLGLLVANLPWNILAGPLGNSLGNLLALLLGYILANLLRDSATLLTRNLDTDLLGHLPGNLLALLARDILTLLSWDIAALLARHLDLNSAAHVLHHI
jgi:hypothetical protein